jgi:hypothetical protein
VAIGAILGAMLVDADYSLPGPRNPADYTVAESDTAE